MPNAQCVMRNDFGGSLDATSRCRWEELQC